MNSFQTGNNNYAGQYGHAPANASSPRSQSDSFPAPPPPSTNGQKGNFDASGTATSTLNSTATSTAPKPIENSKLATELNRFNRVAEKVRSEFAPQPTFDLRCQQAFDIANELFGNAPTWVCFYRELMGGRGFIPLLFPENDDFGSFLRTEQYHQIQLMLTALRSRDLPENDPNDPQRMITVRLPKSLHEAMCDEAGRLNISVNRLCISRMLQLLDPKMIPETQSKPRGRKPRSRTKQEG